MRRGGEGRDSGAERGGMVRGEVEWRMREGIFYIGNRVSIYTHMISK